MTAGAPGGRGAVLQKNVMYRDIGTTLKLTATPAADGVVAVELDIIDSAIRLGEDETTPPDFDVLKLTTTVRVPRGQAAVAHTQTRETKAARVVSVVIVAARVADPAAKAAAR